MKWLVYYHSMNRQEIITLNIFDHTAFRDNVNKLLRECSDKDDFAEKLKKELMYYFGCKSEYEVLISPWCGGRSTKEIKVDVYSQVMLNYDVFVDYVWSNKCTNVKHSAAKSRKKAGDKS